MRLADRAFKIFDLPDIKGGTLSTDGLTILCHKENLLYILDNDFA